MPSPDASTPNLLRLPQARVHERPLPAQDLVLPPGLSTVVGDERSGKTTLLRLISGDAPLASGQRDGPRGAWLDLQWPGQDQSLPDECWAQWARAWPQWNAGLADDLSAAMGLDEHRHKRLFMLSTGSRRKVALIALLACEAPITCLDQPHSGLDGPSMGVLREFLNEGHGHPTRAWVVADYSVDARVPWQQLITLPAPRGQ